MNSQVHTSHGKLPHRSVLKKLILETKVFLRKRNTVPAPSPILTIVNEPEIKG